MLRERGLEPGWPQPNQFCREPGTRPCQGQQGASARLLLGARAGLVLCLLQLFHLLSPQGTPPRRPQPRHTDGPSLAPQGKPPPAGIYTSASAAATLGKVLFSTVNHEAT